MSFKKGDGSTFDAPTAVSTTDKILVAENGVVKEAALSDLPIDALLTPTGVTSGTYGSSSTIARVEIDEDGRVVSATSLPLAITSVNTLLNVSVGSATAGDVLYFSSGEWIPFTLGTLASSDQVSNGNMDNSGVVAGTYGDPGLIPQITVNAQGRVTTAIEVTAFTSTGVTSGTYGAANLIPQFEVDVFGRIRSAVEVTAIVGGSGGTLVTALNDVLDVSAPSPTDGQAVVWRTDNWVASAPWITTAETSALVCGVLANSEYMTSQEVSAALVTFGAITTSEVCAIVCNVMSAGEYMTSQEVSAALVTFGAITTAEVSALVCNVMSVGEYMTSQEVSAAVEAFGYLTSTSASAAFAYRSFGAVSASNTKVCASGIYQTLDLVGGNAISTSASGNRIVVKYTGVSAQTSNSILKYYRQEISTVSGTTNIIPRDTTPPLITEGANLVSVNYAPAAAGSRLQLRWGFYFSTQASNASLVTPVFIDGNTTCVGLTYGTLARNNLPYKVEGIYFVSTSATTTITFNLRYGIDTAASVLINCFTTAGGNTNAYGGNFLSFFEITEYAG